MVHAAGQYSRPWRRGSPVPVGTGSPRNAFAGTACVRTPTGSGAADSGSRSGRANEPARGRPGGEAVPAIPGGTRLSRRLDAGPVTGTAVLGQHPHLAAHGTEELRVGGSNAPHRLTERPGFPSSGTFAHRRVSRSIPACPRASGTAAGSPWSSARPSVGTARSRPAPYPVSCGWRTLRPCTTLPMSESRTRTSPPASFPRSFPRCIREDMTRTAEAAAGAQPR